MTGRPNRRGPHDPWPPLPLADWAETRRTLHMWSQIVGKVRLAQAPMEAEWAQVPLYVTARGLTTSPIPVERPDPRRASYAGTFQIDFDWIEHRLLVVTSTGARRELPLAPPAGPRSVAAFYTELGAMLASLGIPVTITPRPQEIPDPIPFPEDTRPAVYDPEAVGRFFTVLAAADTVLKTHRARFWGKHSPVQFFWGTFDLTYTRFSGRPAEPPPTRDRVTRLAMDAEEIACGFWPGDDRYPAPAFFAYAYPRPDDLERDPVAPNGAFYSDVLDEFLLPYDVVRQSASPAQAILDFAESTYEVGARRLGWDLGELERDSHLAAALGTPPP